MTDGTRVGVPTVRFADAVGTEEAGADAGWVAVPAPRLTWQTESGTPGWRQAHAELELDGKQIVTVEGGDSVGVDWPFAPTQPHTHHRLRVRVTGTDGIPSEWSTPRAITASFLGEGEWHAKFIQAPAPELDAQPFRVRQEFAVGHGLVRATLVATALGVYQVRVNGTAVDDQVLKPGWTPYAERLTHETTDVTALLDAGGKNAIGIDVAGGWFTERWFAPRPRYGSQPAVAAQLRLEYADGSVELVSTDEKWTSSIDGPTRSSGIYDGEHYDARRETLGWDRPGFDEVGWMPVRFVDQAVVPTARTSPAVRRIEERDIRRAWLSPSGAQLFDFGQNLVGVVRLTVKGRAGDVVTIRHAEVLEDGELGVRPLRGAKATDSYTLRGDPAGETWEPVFTFHGFRYIEVSGLDEPIDPEAMSALVVHSDMRRTGWFTSSHSLLNKFHENVVWSMRGNFLSVPTDCPQRDERLGWTGDIQVFAPTANFLFDANSFLSSWLVDLAIEQDKENGIVPSVVPNVWPGAAMPIAAWGDAATIVPDALYEGFADIDTLRRQFPSMRDWTTHALGLVGTSGIWDFGYQLGDWLDPSAPPDFPSQSMTEMGIVCTAYLIRSCDIVARTAGLLGLHDEASYFAEAAARSRHAFAREYVLPDGRMTSDSQTAYSLAISFDLSIDDDQRRLFGDQLARLVRDNGHRIGTGFVGTPLICDALASTGHVDTAAALLLETASPSWLHPVTMGATTIWERWDSMLDDGSINPGEMTSFNHYAFGAVADWLHRSVAGIAPAAPGYRVSRIAPVPLPGLDHASARFDSPYGRIEAGWRLEADEIIVDALVPPNTTALITLPGSDESFEVASGRHRWIVPR